LKPTAGNKHDIRVLETLHVAAEVAPVPGILHGGNDLQNRLLSAAADCAVRVVGHEADCDTEAARARMPTNNVPAERMVIWARL
jgi:hypothetical protein